MIDKHSPLSLYLIDIIKDNFNAGNTKKLY